jgi:hypothetical protein
MPTRLALRARTAPAPVGRGPCPAAGNSAPQSGEGACLPPYRPHPYLHRRAFRGCGNGRWFDRAAKRNSSFVAHGMFCDSTSQQSRYSPKSIGSLGYKFSRLLSLLPMGIVLLSGGYSQPLRIGGKFATIWAILVCSEASDVLPIINRFFTL